MSYYPGVVHRVSFHPLLGPGKYLHPFSHPVNVMNHGQHGVYISGKSFITIFAGDESLQ